MADDTSFQELLDLSLKRREKWTSGAAQRQGERPAQLRFVTTFSDVQSPIALSPDGTHLTSGSPDFTLRIMPITGGVTQQLAGARRGLRCAAWSLDSTLVAAGSRDHNIYVWNWRNGEMLHQLQGHHGTVHTLAWSGDVRKLASGGDDGVRLWDVPSGTVAQTLDTSNLTRSIAWSRGGRLLAAAGDAGLVWIWDVTTGEVTHKFDGYRQPVRALAWSHDDHYLVSAGDDAVIHVWDVLTNREVSRLEGHTNTIIDMAFSADGSLLVSQSRDAGAEVRFWRTDSWDHVTSLPVNPFESTLPLGFQPGTVRLITGGDIENEARMWDVDVPGLAQLSPTETKYTNAKVMLVGDTGVGKSGLRIVLLGQPYAPTESTHGRSVLRFDEQVITVTAPYVRKEQREIFLWDLAGQPFYRLIHQLHLNEVTVALIVFDNRSDVDPFAGVPYWAQVLTQIQQKQGNHLLKKFLIAARTDRGGIGVEPKRIARLQEELGLDDYFETSAKTGKGIEELRGAIKDAINWETLPPTTSTRDFQQIQDFLRREKARITLAAGASATAMPLHGAILSREDDLYRLFVATMSGRHETESLHAEFKRCIKLIENQGEIQRLSFGNFILLYPELLDGYASALINAATEDPAGLGSIAEEDVRAGRFAIPVEVKISDQMQESFLLLAMIEMLVQNELAFREPSTNYLVFPTQATSERDDLPDPQGKTVVFTFAGPLMSIYATLVTRLEHTKMFHMAGRWKNAVEYRSEGLATFGLFLEPLSDNQGRLTIFCSEDANEEMQLHFEQFVHAHLNSQALLGSVDRYRIFTCPHCHHSADPSAVRARMAQGSTWVRCQYCDQKFDLRDGVNRLSQPVKDITSTLNKEATVGSMEEQWRTILEAKKQAGDYDVFLSYDRRDQEAVLDIARQLEKRGVRPWLDRWDIRPGHPQIQEMDLGIQKSKHGAIFIGVENGVSQGWQRREYEALLQESRDRDMTVIPVILPSCVGTPRLRMFLGQTAWVDFRESEPDPIGQLVWAITDKHPDGEH